MNWTWFITIASIVGVIANLKRKRWCFYIWAVTNFLWTLVNLKIGLYSAATLFTLYFLLAIWGIIEWAPKKIEWAHKKKDKN
jgi:nicotinamide riboside transporter PnuC